MSKNIECVICLETLSEKNCYPSPKEATCAHATCKKCLCSYLKEMPDGEYHLGYVSLECPDFAYVVKRVDDMELRRLSLKTAKEKNWCVCPKCNRIIDKVGGCQHIKCICGSKIAYDSARLKKLRDTMFE
ncbi:hypothetical protein BDF21DRAFT_466042 [Thamnidium elegans]|nr:hypothetical protein BDF21DRAFT_466042 [Thamnidium elegans]